MQDEIAYNRAVGKKKNTMEKPAKKIDLKKRFSQMEVMNYVALAIELLMTVVFLIIAVWFSADKAQGKTFLGENNGGIEILTIVIFYVFALVLAAIFVYELLFKDYGKEKAVPRELRNGKVIPIQRSSPDSSEEKKENK